MSEPAGDRTHLPGSDRTLPAGATVHGPADPGATATVTVVVRPRTASTPTPGERLDRDAFLAMRGASEADLAAVATFAAAAGLTVTSSDAARRTVELSGTVDALERAFGVDLHEIEHGGRRFRGRTGGITLPHDLAGIVVAVLGLDTRAQARTHFRIAPPVASHAATSVAYTPLQLATIYDFPQGDGTGQTIALVELGGGFVQADLDAYFGGLGVPSPTVTAVSVGGATNAPTGDPQGPDTEVMLDIEVAGAIAPAAAIAVYFAANTDAGFLNAVTTAIHDAARNPRILSISWGGPESTWTAQATSAFDQAFADAGALGVTVLCAAGDGGSSDGVQDGAAHVDFPASSPNATACGGTALHVTGTSRRESVWNDGANGGATGGGVSDVFPVPAYQANADVPASANPGGRVGRGVPDVAADADPATGYRVRADGSETVVGGTSAVAPLYAGLVARVNQRLGASVGAINAALYAAPTAFHDVTSGSNGAYRARKGWDACTGLGTPIGSAFLTAVTPTAPAPAPAPTDPTAPPSTPTPR